MCPSVLVVDDEPQVRRVLRQKLEQRRYEVAEAADGEEAQKAFLARPFDLVITDILMPEKDGLETILFLRRQHPDVKIIAISAPGNQLYLSSACVLGAQRGFVKPFKLEEVAAAVDALLLA